MARNEKLVSNVTRDGVPQGSAALTILDTSTYPTYTITYEESFFGQRPNLNSLLQGWIYTVKLVPDRIVPGRKIYARHSNGDLSKWAAAKPIDLTPDGFYQHIVYPTYMPALQPYGIDIELFHDEAMQYRIHTVRATTQGVGSASLVIKPVRTTGAQNVIYEGEDFFVQAEIYGGTQDHASGPIQVTIGGLPATAANGHVVSDAPEVMTLFQGKGSFRVSTKQDGQPNTNIPIRVNMGDLSAAATLQEAQPTSANGKFNYQTGVWEYNLGAGASRTFEIFSASLVPGGSDWDPAAGGLTGLYIPTESAFQWNVIDGGYGTMKGAVNYKAIISSWQHANYDRNHGTTSDPQSIIKGIIDAGNGQVASVKGLVREFDGLKIEVLEERMDNSVFIPRRITKYRLTNNSTNTKSFNFIFSQMGWLRQNEEHGRRGATIINNVTIDGQYVSRAVTEMWDGYIVVSN